jgi:Zn-dependent metalloprotease
MERDRVLQVREKQVDTLVPGRTFVRLDQFHRGVPVWGGEVVREEDEHLTMSVLTNLYQGIAIGTEPAISPEAAKRIIERLGGATLGRERKAQLVIYPMDDGSYRLAYTEKVATLADQRRFFVDAKTGERLGDYSEVLRQAAVGTGTGVLGDTKKISTTLANGTYYADDSLRPPALHTYDMRGNPYKWLDWLNGGAPFYQSDQASDADNTWTDAAAVDAHVHVGWAYDYFFKRMGRRGFDDNNSRALPIIHVVNRQDLQYYVDAGLISSMQNYYINAAYYRGNGAMMFGEGLPAPWTAGGQSYNYMAGGLDIVAHEYAHGVTDYSSHLGSTGEPRSLNEGFSDMMATAVDFYYRPTRANYTMADEVVSGGGFRSLANPASYGDVDHYSKRKPFVGGEYENSCIASHAFYLAIEGGTNRTSGMTVQGVGPTNREQVEKAFYRGFTSLTSQATFGLARARTIESARTLYGSGSAVERAITQAWDAVGVQ